MNKDFILQSDLEKIDGLTMEQWERVIKVEQPCENCRPIIQQGHTHAWWPEIGTDKKPEGLADDARVLVHNKAMDAWFGLTEASKVMWQNMDAFYWPVILEENNNG